MTTIDVPVCDPCGFFQRRPDVSSNKGALNNLSGDRPDGQAIFSLLQFGAVIPPLSPWTGVERLLPGYRYENGAVVQPPQFSTLCNSSSQNELSAIFIERFDKGLLCELNGTALPVVLFSGGVDSGLIAARLVRLGYRDTLLLNYSFGPEDKESALAEAMAQALGLKFERFGYEQLGCDSLEAPGKVYHLPFCDKSTVPTYALAKAAEERLKGVPCVIFDGTGADGGFGMTRKINQWLNLERVPQWALKTASWIYERSGIWHQANAFEYRMRLLRRLHDMPVLSAILAQNPLAGILYASDGREKVDALLDEWVSGLVGDTLLRKVIAADLALTCANTFAQKAYPVFRKDGLRVAYPFMEHEMVDFALAVAPSQGGNEKKALLKALLAQEIPNEMVYRPKSGFVDPSGQVFYDAKFLEMLWAATEEKSVLSGLLFKDPLRRVCDRLRHHDRLPDQLLNCIWAIVFTDRWYRTV